MNLKKLRKITDVSSKAGKRADLKARVKALVLKLQHIAGFTDIGQQLTEPSDYHCKTWWYTKDDGIDALVTVDGYYDDGLVYCLLNVYPDGSYYPNKYTLAKGTLTKDSEDEIISQFKKNIEGMSFYGFQERK